MNNPLDEIRGSVFKPARRRYFVLRYFDPATGKQREKSTKQTRERDALNWAREYAAGVVDGKPDGRITWHAFCELYETHLEAKSPKTLEGWGAVKYWIALYRPLYHLDDVTSAYVLLWQAHLESRLSPTSVSSYSTRMRAAMNWAARHDLIVKAPTIHCEVCDQARSRAITAKEFDRLLAVAKKTRPGDYQLERFLRGLWESGLRLSELHRLSWDTDCPVFIDTGGQYPVVVFTQGSHKRKRAYVQPITPEFWAVCCEAPKAERTGPVFPTGRTVKYLGDLVSGLGGNRESGGAGIVTNAETGKFASAHDLRRSFARRMKTRVPREQIGKWTRHNDNATLETYYLQENAQELAARLWDQGDKP